MTDTDHPAPATPHAVAAAGRIIPDIEHTGDTAGLRRLLREAHNRNRELTDALEQAQADTARLDWFERMANEPGGLLLHDGSETGRRGLGLRHGSLVRSLRTAIDKAMAMAHREADATHGD